MSWCKDMQRQEHYKSKQRLNGEHKYKDRNRFNQTPKVTVYRKNKMFFYINQLFALTQFTCVECQYKCKQK